MPSERFSKNFIIKKHVEHSHKQKSVKNIFKNRICLEKVLKKWKP